jgi:hypothetical protein
MPPLRQAAIPLGASGGQRSAKVKFEKRKIKK